MKIKKKHLFIGLSLAMCFVGCSDDDLTNGFKRPVSGDEVVFGTGTGEFNIDPKQQPKGGTRTVYVAEGGQNFKNYTSLSVEWQKDDQVRIFSPQAEANYKTADYTVISKEGDADDMVYKNGFLVKIGDTGIRWGTTTETHNFYAFYPTTVKSNNMITGLQTDARVRAEIPVAQEHGKLYTYDNEGNESSGDMEGDWKIIAPDMSFAMMVAEADYNPSTSTKSTIELNFKPIVTVLDVAINGPKAIEGMPTSYKILQVNVYSEGENSQAIVGPFIYDFSKPEGTRFDFSEVDAASADYKLATVDCMYNQEALELKTGQILNVKFFLLPRDIKAGDLTVSILLEGGHVVEKKLDNNASLNISDIILKQGKIIKIKTPYIEANAQTNNWMNLIDGNVYFASQLSLPGSKHSYTYNTFEGEDSKDTEINYLQSYQSLTLTEQFNKGIRAFDVKVNVSPDGTNPNIFASENDITINSVPVTLPNMLTELKGLIKAGNSEATEGVVVSINYVNGRSTNEKDWLDGTIEAIRNWDAANSGVLRTLTSSTTMNEMRGRIAILLNSPLTNPDVSNIGSLEVTVIAGCANSSSEISHLNLAGATNGQVHIQNFYQVNNPDIKDFKDNKYDTSSKGFYGNTTDGLLPYYITEPDNPIKSTDLIGKKIELMNELFSLSKNNNTQNGNVKIQNIYINDLGGFCVVKHPRSTGHVRWDECEYSVLQRQWAPNNKAGGYYYKYEDVPTENPNPSTYDYFGYDTPPSDWLRRKWYRLEDGSFWGQGGNSALFAEKVNPKAMDVIYKLVNEARTPLGIVFINFAGTDHVKIGTKSEGYDVKGLSLPSMIMTNNFKFPLEKRQ